MQTVVTLQPLQAKILASVNDERKNQYLSHFYIISSLAASC